MENEWEERSLGSFCSMTGHVSFFDFHFFPRTPPDSFRYPHSYLASALGGRARLWKAMGMLHRAWQARADRRMLGIRFSCKGCGLELLTPPAVDLWTYITHSQDFIFQEIESKATVDFLQKKKDLFGSAIAWNYMVGREARPAVNNLPLSHTQRPSYQDCLCLRCPSDAESCCIYERMCAWSWAVT